MKIVDGTCIIFNHQNKGHATSGQERTSKIEKLHLWQRISHPTISCSRILMKFFALVSFRRLWGSSIGANDFMLISRSKSATTDLSW